MSNPATELARDALQQLLDAGVRELVVSPGSRNAPLAFAAYDAAAAGMARLHTRLDERTAGFLALGLGRTGAPAAVICTSGTAVANLHPAVLEAAHSAVPLVVVTADRPAALRGTSANQTTDQPGIFGKGVAGVDLAVPADLSDLLAAARDGAPVHVNLQFDDPLVPEGRWLPSSAAEPPRGRRRSSPKALIDVPADEIPAGPATVVIAGDDAGPAARLLAEAAGWPLLAEPTSGARTGDAAIRCYRLLLEQPLGARVERAVVFGRPTLSRPVNRLLARDDVEVWARREPGAASARPFAVARSFDAVAAPSADDPEWLEAWQVADRSVSRQLDALVAAEADLTPYQVAAIVGRAVPAGGLLHVGASNPIRDLDLMLPRYRPGARRKLIANRGLAGIDGTISTAIGAALGRPSSARCLALLGDVTFLHDLTGLVLGPDEPRPDLTLVVVNDDGGSIFAVLEQGAPAYADRYDRLFGLPHGADLASACAAARVPHLRVRSVPELEQALAMPNGGIEVVEAVVRRDNRRDLDARIRALRP